MQEDISLQNLLKQWKTKIVTVIFGGKILAVDQYELLLKDLDDTFNLAMNVAGIALILIFRHLGVIRERAAEQTAESIKSFIERKGIKADDS